MEMAAQFIFIVRRASGAEVEGEFLPRNAHRMRLMEDHMEL